MSNDKRMANIFAWVQTMLSNRLMQGAVIGVAWLVPFAYSLLDHLRHARAPIGWMPLGLALVLIGSILVAASESNYRGIAIRTILGALIPTSIFLLPNELGSYYPIAVVIIIGTFLGFMLSTVERALLMSFESPMLILVALFIAVFTGLCCALGLIVTGFGCCVD